ncbi:phytoene desaturase family protein [Cohnella panacarvi]|uniref:phytoene desaturase family protein n=1 Tax=Cohnella panacarvi TaxID=400776 RepID=UPI00047DBC90|nr:NAD(P)/FAD-dependent oxidoreductase [Cohnella panacarvi]
MNNVNETIWDVVVIGAGAAGLTASIYLAKAGRKVLLLERGAQPGGRAASQELAGARLNLGPHAVYKSALRILEEVGVTVTGAAPGQNGKFLFEGADGEEVVVPLYKLMLGSFLKWSEKSQMIRFYARLRKMDTSALQHVSLQDYLDERFASPRVRGFVQALVRVSSYCNAPELVSAGAVIDQLKMSQVLYVDGGWQSIVDQLKNRAHHAGVTIHSGTVVREISGSSPRMTVQLKDGSRLSARSVLSTAGPTETLALLDSESDAPEAEIYKRLVPVRAACLDLVVSGMPEPATKFALGADYPWYYSNHSAAARLTDDARRSVIHVMKYLPPAEPSDATRNERELEHFLDRIQPGWRKHVVERRYLPHMTVSHAVVTASGGGLAGRPGVAVAGRPGLYVAGDWVGSEGMLLNASLASAKEAAQCIIADIRMEKEGMTRGA